MKNAEFLQLKRSHVRMNCNADADSKSKFEKGDTCQWSQPDGKSINERRMKIDKKTCQLEMTNLLTLDGGTFECLLSKNKGLTRLSFRRHVVVFSVPNFFFQLNVTYFSRSCDAKKLLTLQMEMQTLFCSGILKDCHYKFSIVSCSGYDSLKVLNIDLTTPTIYTVTYRIERHLGKNVELPKCTLKCMKEAYMAKLLDDRHRELIAQYNAIQDIWEELTGFVRRDDLSNHKILGDCPHGFFSYKEQVCLPCPAGYYRDEKGERGSCLECGYWHYQPKIAQDFCVMCAWGGFSYVKNSNSHLHCIPLYMSWHFMVAVTTVFMLCFVFIVTGSANRMSTWCLEKFRVRKYRGRDKRLNKEMIYDMIEPQDMDERIQTPSRMQGSIMEKMKALKHMPKELKGMTNHLTTQDADWLAKDMTNIKDFSLTYDPRSTGMTKEYRKRRKQRYRVDDRILPDAIKGRQHKSLGWTHKYDTSSFKKKVRKDTDLDDIESLDNL